jgi:PhoH-like ATPase
MLAFEENEVVIPLAVIEEIDNQKRRQDEIGRNARTVSKILDGLRSSGSLSRGIALANGGRLRVEMNHQELIGFPKGLDPHKYDNRILALAHNLSLGDENHVSVVTKDLNLRIKADVMGIAAEDFVNDKVDYHDLYTGVREIFLNREDMDAFYRNGRLTWEMDQCPNPHEFVILKNPENPSQSALAHFQGNDLCLLNHEEAVNWGIKARNKEQRFALELLMDDEIQVVTLVGCAGTGNYVKHSLM